MASQEEEYSCPDVPNQMPGIIAFRVNDGSALPQTFQMIDSSLLVHKQQSRYSRAQLHKLGQLSSADIMDTAGERHKSFLF